MNGTLKAAIILALSLLLGCGAKSKPDVAKLLPSSNEVPGWTKTSETRVFPAERLYEYIDGDADKYVRAGVQQTLTADYRFGEKTEATADIFVMAAPDGAAAVFESQTATGGQPIALGDAARAYRGSLSFRQGRYFVRVVAYEDAPDVSDALTALGQGISNKLHQR